MSNNTTQSPIWEAILKYCGANAINVADSYYNKVTRDVGTSLDKLRQNQVAAITAGIKASYAIASAMLMASLVEAASQLAGAYGSKEALNEINPAEKEVNNANQGFSKLEKQEKALQSDLVKNKEELDGLKTKKENLKKVAEKKQTNLSNKSQKATTKAQMLTTAAQGAATIPSALANTFKTKGEAINSVLQTLIGMLNSTYDKSNQTLRSFLEIDYLGGLVALGQIQLR
ncbi:MAG: hypothetical protein K940chlam5_00137 [Candidatus Anoxychlamydiales bacterium]|nr:hypothetical protein [Candidatus Anoxychlamydiales bacterium]